MIMMSEKKGKFGKEKVDLKWVLLSEIKYKRANVRAVRGTRTFCLLIEGDAGKPG